jgi:hypothetical protein
LPAFQLSIGRLLDFGEPLFCYAVIVNQLFKHIHILGSSLIWSCIRSGMIYDPYDIFCDPTNSQRHQLVDVNTCCKVSLDFAGQSQSDVPNQ